MAINFSNGDRMADRCHLLFLTVMPSPYQQQLFHELSEQRGVEIKVLYYTATVSGRQWRAPSLEQFERIMPGRALSLIGLSTNYNLGVIRELKHHKDCLVVISDYSALTAQVAMWYLTVMRRKWVYWGETPGMSKGLFRRAVRGLLIMPLKLGASAVCAIGGIAAERYRRILGPGKPIFNIPYFCDLTPFIKATKTRSERVTLLFCGQFIRRKGLDVLLDAFVRVASEVPLLDLLMAGGSEYKGLLHHVPEAFHHRIRFAGFIQTSDLPEIYGQADLFVLPSRHDGWGVVVNEAVGSGLPVIVSDRVGAMTELVEHGVNGFVFRSENAAELADYIRELATSEERREAFSRASTKLAQHFGLEEGVKRWKSVCAQLSDEPAV